MRSKEKACQHAQLACSGRSWKNSCPQYIISHPTTCSVEWLVAGIRAAAEIRLLTVPPILQKLCIYQVQTLTFRKRASFRGGLEGSIPPRIMKCIFAQLHHTVKCQNDLIFWSPKIHQNRFSNHISWLDPPRSPNTPRQIIDGNNASIFGCIACSLCVSCPYVGHTSEPCKNGWTDRDAVLRGTEGGTLEWVQQNVLDGGGHCCHLGEYDWAICGQSDAALCQRTLTTCSLCCWQVKRSI